MGEQKQINEALNYKVEVANNILSFFSWGWAWSDDVEMHDVVRSNKQMKRDVKAAEAVANNPPKSELIDLTVDSQDSDETGGKKKFKWQPKSKRMKQDDCY